MRFHTMTTAALVLLGSVALALGDEPDPVDGRPNLAIAATPSTSYVSGHETLGAINDGLTPRHSNDRAGPIYGNWPRRGEQWVELDWLQPITTDGSAVYWFEDGQGIRRPESAALLYLDADGKTWRPIDTVVGVEKNQWNVIDHAAVKTQALRLMMTGRGEFSTGVIEWRVFDEGSSPAFPPIVEAGADRIVMVGGQTMLRGTAKGVREDQETAYAWTVASGPGEVRFSHPDALVTEAEFGRVGEYTIALKATAGGLSSSDRLHVRVEVAPPAAHLTPVPVEKYSIDSAFWEPRLKSVIERWIPHCIAKCEEPDLKEGGLNNMIEAGRKLRGEPFKRHVGYPFANAWVLNTLESMCVAQMLDAAGDAELAAAQAALRKKIDEWVPIVLAAQEPDGYFQTRFTLGRDGEGDAPHWDPRYRTEHEGYVAGYFIEAGIAHAEMTGGSDRRMYDAAKKLADTWCAHLGPPPKKSWYDGHEGMEIALFRLARLVDRYEGAGAGGKYADLAEFLVSQRGTSPAKLGDQSQNYGLGAPYDQSQAPVDEQYEAVGHAVRAVYLYSAMAEAAARTGDKKLEGAIYSICDDLVNRKYYVTGGVGSGETAEGFGEAYSLPVHAYCESCSGVGEMIFQHRMGLLDGRAGHADLLEETLYNAVLSDIDLAGENFTYTNPLDTDEARYKWHVCPCCVGNIPRALLSLPTWTYAAGDGVLRVNLFVGGTMRVPDVAGTPVELTQETDYPRSGKVAITLRPEQPESFALEIRVPDWSVSEIYASTPPLTVEDVAGAMGLRVNGEPVKSTRRDGYAVIDRTWKTGDRVEFELPMPVQRVRAIDKVPSLRGQVALRRGPLVFNFEAVDQDLGGVLLTDEPLTAAYDPDLLGGVMTIRGKFVDGRDLVAIPNYARNNRGGRSMVWIREGVRAGTVD